MNPARFRLLMQYICCISLVMIPIFWTLAQNSVECKNYRETRCIYSTMDASKDTYQITLNVQIFDGDVCYVNRTIQREIQMSDGSVRQYSCFWNATAMTPIFRTLENRDKYRNKLVDMQIMEGYIQCFYMNFRDGIDNDRFILVADIRRNYKQADRYYTACISLGAVLFLSSFAWIDSNELNPRELGIV